MLGIGVIAGIMSGIVVTALVAAFCTFWKRIAEPYYEELIYHDARIEGRWEIRYPDATTECHETVDLKRKGHAVTGTIAVTAGKDLGKSYSFCGTFKNLNLTGEYSATNRATLDRGTFALRLTNNGSTFTGCSVFYNDDRNEMDSSACHWKKQKE